MKFRRKTLFILIISLIIITLMNWTTVLAEEKLSIEVLPAKELFDVSNMKPGDWAPRTTTIRNNGEVGFEYTTSVKPNSESLKLYNELLLEVWDGNEELYNGKLSEFTGFPLRVLSPNEEEELEYTVRFPEHLGNEFQGLDAKFTIYYTAEAEDTEESGVESVTGTIDSGNSTDGGILPNTATNMFAFLLIGMLLITVGSIVGLLVLYNKRSKA
ncbi:LPXTG cell wall anchor domain-containing protein [Oceanobacillus sp. Castelsardo]|uniref:LPXTG cell wall anchor domain-containing protein n=1 Tax=Oceanobacillus sp. Castelsardo TaxID=1851204 RepID=UPI000837C90B|nr:LPXTG cell wall anchor domain-containing protein [Oceanobacillus sp. Castelsardo]